MVRRNRNIVVKSQFNIAGSRGKSVKPFITQYVSRESAVKPVLGYYPNTSTYEVGDGSCFTFNKTAISRDNVLKIADHVEDLFLSNKRAIQQMVISFDSDFLREMNVVDPSVSVLKKGDYEDNYDDIRMRYVIRQGVREIADRDGYNEPKMIGTIQHDTHHIHAHVVLYDDGEEYGRKRGREEKGKIKSSSFAYGTQEMERVLERTKSINVTRNKLLIEQDQHKHISNSSDDNYLNEKIDISYKIMQDYLNDLYLQKLKEKEEEKERIKQEIEEKMKGISDNDLQQ
jgi:hypothetical protein